MDKEFEYPQAGDLFQIRDMTSDAWIAKFMLVIDESTVACYDKRKKGWHTYGICHLQRYIEANDIEKVN